MSAALTIARWMGYDCTERQADAWAKDHSWVRAAELAVIERGLAEEYGNALLLVTALGPRFSEGSVAQFAVTLATASLDVRVRALSAVIRAQEAKA